MCFERSCMSMINVYTYKRTEICLELFFPSDFIVQLTVIVYICIRPQNNGQNSIPTDPWVGGKSCAKRLILYFENKSSLLRRLFCEALGTVAIEY